MNEADTRAELIEPALRAAGWDEPANHSSIRREVSITQGRLMGAGRRGKRDIADYILIYRHCQLAVIEAKRRDLPASEGLNQAKRYAKKLDIRFAYATNGREIYQIDRHTGAESPLSAYPSPQQLWAMTFADDAASLETRTWRDRLAGIPPSSHQGHRPYYYQSIAIHKALEAIAQGQQRLLLTLATGTGKTFIAFQIAWKLFHSRWNLTRSPSRRPRILFLADRNILANQAYNAFSAFPHDALVRIRPDSIRKKGGVPTHGSLFFTIFQTFMTEKDSDGKSVPYFGDYPPDFFDFIIIDECHRGGAADESSWRSIMDYFSPAVQLGLTATPKQDDNADSYAYFGEPIYVYSLREGINDGFLTPFKVRQTVTTLDEYIYTSDDQVIEGHVQPGERFALPDHNRKIRIEERERYLIKLLIKEIDPCQKTIIFCATQDHARRVRDGINQCKASSDPDYCVRVTADDGEMGEQYLRDFQDNEKTIPTILTTSQKLSTGVDARNVRHIVLMRPIQSMITFKQIIGRGTRLYEGKDYFTIYDFVKASEHFHDPDWDGEPLGGEPLGGEPLGGEPLGGEPLGGEPLEGEPLGEPLGGEARGDESLRGEPLGDEASADSDAMSSAASPENTEPGMITIMLADGKERDICHISMTMFYSPEGRPLSSAEFIEKLYGQLPELFRNEDNLRALWRNPVTRKTLLDKLAEQGYGPSELAESARIINAPQSDIFDVLAYIAYARPPISRKARADRMRPLLNNYHDKLKQFLAYVLDQYQQHGTSELDKEKLPKLLEARYFSITDAEDILGIPHLAIKEQFIEFQHHLYQ